MTDLLYAIQGSSIHNKISHTLYDHVQPGMTPLDIVLYIESMIQDEIRSKGWEKHSGIAFPVGIGINNCVAHYSPLDASEPENRILTSNDIVKIDFGVHVHGIIIDSALTLYWDEKFKDFIDISRQTTQFAIQQCKPDAVLGDIGTLIQEYVESQEVEIDGCVYPLKTMRDLSGHSIRPYTIHGGKAVPNVSISYPVRMYEGEFFAVEPFLTTGKGISLYREPNSHFMLKTLPSGNHAYYDFLYQQYQTLPFCIRWLDQIEWNKEYKYMRRKQMVTEYPPIYDIEQSYVSQFEHTLYIREKGGNVCLTRHPLKENN